MRRRLAFLVLAFFVLPTLSLTADQPLVAPEGAPKYSLSNFRVETDNFGRTGIVFEYKRTSRGESPGPVRLVVKDESGEQQIIGVAHIWDESGDYMLTPTFGGFRNQTYNYEVYLVTNANWAGKNYGVCMVSNAIQVGKPGSKTKARAWDDEEKAAFAKHQLGKNPPKELPKGYEAVYRSTKLLPGMIVMAGSYGEWEEAELLSLSADGTARVRFIGGDRLVNKPVEKWLAVSPKVLAEAKSNPDQFQPSMRVLSTGKLPLPDDAIPLDEIELVKGTPLLYEWGGKWSKAFFVRMEDEWLYVHYEGKESAFDGARPRTDFAIRRSTLEKLADDESGELFAKNLRGTAGSKFPGREKSGRERVEEHRLDAERMHRQHLYKMDIPVPGDSELLSDDLPLPKGTELAVCKFRKWKLVSVIKDNKDGTVEVSFDGLGSGFDESLERELLIIRKETAKQLAKRSNGSNAAQPRTWTDVSGKHEMLATYVRHSKSKVVLKTKKGTKTVPISKLCDGDREYLKNLGSDSAAENPFE